MKNKLSPSVRYSFDIDDDVPEMEVKTTIEKKEKPSHIKIINIKKSVRDSSSNTRLF